jgi:hypothetical protein
MTSLSDIAQMTDIDRVSKILAQAANRMKRIDAECEGAFRTWLDAQAAADEAGLVADLKVSPGLAAHLADYKQRQTISEGQDVARDEFSIKAHSGHSG